MSSPAFDPNNALFHNNSFSTHQKGNITNSHAKAQLQLLIWQNLGYKCPIQAVCKFKTKAKNFVVEN